MDRSYSTSIKVIYAVAFAVAAYLAFARPMTIREAILWDDLIRPPFRTAFFAPDAWSGWVYAVLAKRTIGLFRLSEFTLRLPAVLAAGAYLALLPRRLLFVIVAVVPVALGCFSTAGGVGLALAFCAAAWRWRRAAPLLIGFAVAASPVFALPLAALAVAAAVRGGFAILERVAIPALVFAFILSVLPLSRADGVARPAAGGREVAVVHNALLPIRGRTVRISAPAPVRPLVAFYKARYRERGWEITDVQPNISIAP